MIEKNIEGEQDKNAKSKIVTYLDWALLQVYIMVYQSLIQSINP